MPKPKPDQVVRHEFVLGRSERAMLEPYFTALMARNATKAWFNITSDMTTVVVTVIAYEYLTNRDTGILEAISGAAGGLAGYVWAWMVDGWIAHKARTAPERAAAYNERAHSVTGGIVNLIDNIFGGMFARGWDHMHGDEGVFNE